MEILHQRKRAGAHLNVPQTLERVVGETMALATPLAVVAGLIAPVVMLPSLVGGVAGKLVGDSGARGTRSWFVGAAAHGFLDASIRPGGLAYDAAARSFPAAIQPASTISTSITAQRLISARSLLQRGGFALSAALGAAQAIHIVRHAGSAAALITTLDGRGAALQALGSALAVSVQPAFQLASGICMIAALLNLSGVFDFLGAEG